MYHCVCTTCGRDSIMEGLDEAQDFFAEHAKRGCEVEILNVGIEQVPGTPDMNGPDTSAGTSRTAGE